MSTSVDFPSTSWSSTSSNDVYVNLLSQDDEPGTATTSCSQSSSVPQPSIQMMTSWKTWLPLIILGMICTIEHMSFHIWIPSL